MECIAAQQPYTMKILCSKLISNYLVRHFLEPNRCIRRPGPVATKYCTKALAVVISSQYDVNDLLYNVIEKHFLLDVVLCFLGRAMQIPAYANSEGLDQHMRRMNLNMCILRMFEDTFLLGAAYII